MDDSSDSSRKPRGPSSPMPIGQLASRLFESSSPRDMECRRCGRPVLPVNLPLPAFMGRQSTTVPGRCRVCDEEERQREEAEREARIARARSLGGNGAGLVLTAPRLHQIKPDLDNSLAYKALTELVRDGGRSPRACWLWGAVGTGKSYLAQAALLSLYDLGARVAAYSEPELQSDIIRAVKGKGAEAPISRLDEADVVLLDDVGLRQPGGAARREIEEFIHRRYAAQRWQMVITSNAALGQVPDMDPAVVSRLHQMCEGRVISLVGPDRRRQR